MTGSDGENRSGKGLVCEPGDLEALGPDFRAGLLKGGDSFLFSPPRGQCSESSGLISKESSF